MYDAGQQSPSPEQSSTVPSGHPPPDVVVVVASAGQSFVAFKTALELIHIHIILGRK